MSKLLHVTPLSNTFFQPTKPPLTQNNTKPTTVWRYHQCARNPPDFCHRSNTYKAMFYHQFFSVHLTQRSTTESYTPHHQQTLLSSLIPLNNITHCSDSNDNNINISHCDDFASCRLVLFCFHFLYAVIFDSILTTGCFFKLISPFSFDLFDLFFYVRKRDFGFLLCFLQKKRMKMGKEDDVLISCHWKGKRRI